LFNSKIKLQIVHSFLSIFLISKQIRLKVGDQKKEKCHTGDEGCHKSAKKVSRII
jgi:hypothetical protein